MIEKYIKYAENFRKVGDIFPCYPDKKTKTGRDYIELCLGGDYKRYLKGEKVPQSENLGINASFLFKNISEECYREVMVSYIHMLPLLKNTVSFKEADYILYMHPYARCEDLGKLVLDEIRWIDKNRKKGAEIIVLGKATNVKDDLEENEIENITYVPCHFCEYLGKRFNMDIKEQYVVYDDQLKQLSIWPVDGCKNKCNFCRRSYMDIPFESQSLEFLKEKLDWFKKNEPEKMKKISLRAENLTQYGLDIYDHKPCLEKVLKLLISYDEVEEIYAPIGLCIGEMTDEVVNTICSSKKFKGLALNLEAASDRLNQLCGKKHTMEQARNMFYKIRQANPEILLYSTIMLGIPTETVGEVESFADFINELGLDYLHCNFYQHNERDGFKNEKKFSERGKFYHLKLFMDRLKKLDISKWYGYRYLHPTMEIRCRSTEIQKDTRKNILKREKLKKMNLARPHEFPKNAFFNHVFQYFPDEYKEAAEKAYNTARESGNMMVDFEQILIDTYYNEELETDEER